MAKVKTPTCHECAYSYFDRGQWVMALGSGWPSRPACANHPESAGRMRPVVIGGGVCRNFRARAATPEGDVRQIPLGDGYYAYVDAADYEWLSQWTWSLKNGYAVRREKGKLIFMHREIARPPKGKVVDHQNRNRADNTRANLWVCTPKENGRNRGKRQGVSSRFRGVSYDTRAGKWRAQIWFPETHMHIGYFPDEVEAARAYDRKAVELFGQDAKLNFPEEWPARRIRRSTRGGLRPQPNRHGRKKQKKAKREKQSLLAS